MKRLLVLSFFPAFTPPESGGELRLYNLYRHASKQFLVDLVSWTYEAGRQEQIAHTPNFKEHRIPKDDNFRAAYSKLHRHGTSGELSGITCAMVGRAHTAYHETVASLSRQADAIVHESPFTVPYDQTPGTGGTPRIYNSYNVESEMTAAILRGTGAKSATDLIWELEDELCHRSRIVFATCNDDLEKFRHLYGTERAKLRLAPNAYCDEEFTIPNRQLRRRDEYVLFLGSQHIPNIEAAEFITKTVAPQLPHVKFKIAGNVATFIKATPCNVELIPRVNSDAKRKLFEHAAIFANPIFTGSGTSLKVVEAMAASLPIVTTRTGARGYGLIHNSTAVFAEENDFVAELAKLTEDRQLRQKIGNNANAYATQNYTWERVSATFVQEITKAIQGRTQYNVARPLTLHVNDYSVSNATSGGARRIRRLMTEISKNRDVVLLCLHGQSAVEVEELSPNLTEIRIPKTAAHKDLQDLINGKNWISVNDLVSALSAVHNKTLRTYFERLSKHAETIIFCHPYMSPLLSAIPVRIPIIYDAQNVEAELKEEILKTHTDAHIFIPFASRLESNILDSAHGIVACTDEDLRKLSGRQPAASGAVIQNGCDILPLTGAKKIMRIRAKRDLGKSYKAIFIGSGHPPNVEAAMYLCKEILPSQPDMQLIIVGAVSEALQDCAHSTQLRRYGVVSDFEKRELLLDADIALNPVTTGGGSNLKISDYLGHAVPTITTAEGARGFNLNDGIDALIRPLNAFSSAIQELRENTTLRQAIGANGYGYASSTLAWEILGAKYNDVINSISNGSGTRSRRKLLVVTYRYTEPTEGGAEEYLSKLLTEYRSQFGANIDIAVPDIGTVSNSFGFITNFQTLNRKPTEFLAPFLRRITLFQPESHGVEEDMKTAEFLWEEWQAEQRQLARASLPFLSRTTLLGGWFSPEYVNGMVQRWASAHAEIFIEKNVFALRVSGWIDRKVEVEVQLDDELIEKVAVSGEFSIELVLNSTRTHCIRMQMPAKRAGDADPRYIGFLLRKIEVVEKSQGTWRPIALEESFETYWREKDSQAWIDALRRQAEARSDRYEAAFHKARGPRSAALVSYVSDVANEYDAVLVQGVPFGLTVDVVDALRIANVPALVLPHFHADDQFYHWRQFYDVFVKADAVLSVSEIVSERLFNPIGASATLIPGGGVDPLEYVDHRTHRGEFDEFRGHTRPYFLVLGRKTGSKGYRGVMEAHRLYRETTGIQIDLVMIGEDEDGVVVDSEGVYYYGRLSRALTIGALSGCVAVVNMSTSESFGIVILESWMVGRPVIVNRNCISFAELVDDEVDGILVADVRELADAMKLVVDDPGAAISMGVAGLKKATRDFTWSRVAGIFNDIVEGVLEKRARSGTALAEEAE